MAKGIRNSFIEETGEKPSKPLPVRCFKWVLKALAKRSSWKRHLSKGEKGIALRISGALGLGDIHRDIWMEERVKRRVLVVF